MNQCEHCKKRPARPGCGWCEKCFRAFVAREHALDDESRDLGLKTLELLVTEDSMARKENLPMTSPEPLH